MSLVDDLYFACCGAISTESWTHERRARVRGLVVQIDAEGLAETRETAARCLVEACRLIFEEGVSNETHGLVWAAVRAWRGRPQATGAEILPVRRDFQ